ncbi:MAG: hypothetical protein LBV27_00270, partial [Oscillospiraceae bacterium]|nr:hypothetical protein [Oscillospiraceae bacterium]
MLKKADLLIIGAVLAAATLFFVGFRLLSGGGAQKQAAVYIDGELAYTLPLPDKEQLFYITTETGYNIL